MVSTVMAAAAAAAAAAVLRWGAQQAGRQAVKKGVPAALFDPLVEFVDGLEGPCQVAATQILLLCSWRRAGGHIHTHSTARRGKQQGRSWECRLACRETTGRQLQ